MRNWLVLLCLVAAMPCAAQPDFLRADEVDQLREAQEPNGRLLLYVRFAKERVDLVGQLAAKEKAGRSMVIHDTLKQYTEIIDAIDTVIDDAFRRKAPVDKGVAATATAQKQMLAALEKVAASRPADLARYEFALEQAIETTRDSLNLALEDLKDRAAEVASRDEKEKKQRESLMRPEEVEVKRATEKKEAEQKKKAPTLRRKDEAVKEKP
jgi:FtsZ-binding cell division protein ZapB